MDDQPITIVQFVEYGIDPDDEKQLASYYNLQAVPRIGDTVQLRTSRDEDGNYIDPQGRPSRVIVDEGLVKKVSWYFEECGKDFKSNRRYVYIIVELEILK